MRDWDDLLTSEPTEVMDERFRSEKERKEDTLEVHLDYDSISGGNDEVRKELKESVGKDISDFVVGGCMPEGDGEIKCRFKLLKNMYSIVKKGREYNIKLENPELRIEDADQARSSGSKFEKLKSGLGIVSNGSYIFCESKEGKLSCKRYEAPEGVLTLKEKVKEGIVTGKNKTVDLEPKEEFETETIKFPVGGKVTPHKKRDMVQVDL